MAIWIERPGRTRFYCGPEDGRIKSFTNAHSMRTMFADKESAEICLEQLKKTFGVKNTSISEVYEKQCRLELLLPGTIIIKPPHVYDPVFVSSYDEEAGTPVIGFTHDPRLARLFSVDSQFRDNELFDIKTLVNTTFAISDSETEQVLFPQIELIAT